MTNQEFLLYFAVAVCLGFWIYSAINKKLHGALLQGNGLLVTSSEGILAVAVFVYALFFENDGSLFIRLSVVVMVLFGVVNFFRFRRQYGGGVFTGVLSAVISVCGYFAGIFLMVVCMGAGAKQTNTAQAYQARKETELMWADEFATSHGYNNANEWARDHGYVDASDAFDKGFFNGKLGQ